NAKITDAKLTKLGQLLQERPFLLQLTNNLPSMSFPLLIRTPDWFIAGSLSPATAPRTDCSYIRRLLPHRHICSIGCPLIRALQMTSREQTECISRKHMGIIQTVNLGKPACKRLQILASTKPGAAPFLQAKRTAYNLGNGILGGSFQ